MSSARSIAVGRADRVKTVPWPVLLSVGVAFAFALSFPALYVGDSPGYLDPARAWAAGQGLREGNGQPLQYRLPLFPLALGVTIRLFGEDPRAFTVMNVGFLVLAALVVRRALLPRGRALADGVAVVILLYPPLLTSAALVLQETLLSLLIAVVFVLAGRAVEEPSAGRSLAAGAALGVAALGKLTILPVGLGLAVLIGAWGRRSWIHVGALALGSALVLGPWMVRNQSVLGRLEITTGNAGHTLLGGTVSNRIENWFTFPEYVEARREWEQGAPAGEGVLDAHLTRVALRRIAAHPARWLALCAERALRFMLPARTWFVQAGHSRTGTFGPIYLIATAFNVGLFALVAWLAARALRKRDRALLVGPVIVFGHLAVYAVVYASPRYGVTVGPVLIATAGLALAEIRRGRQRLGAATAAEGAPAAP
jgi:hypothetical protein